MSAQLVRMNTTASNLANATTVAGSEKDAFRAKRPVFKALLEEEMTHAGAPFVELPRAVPARNFTALQRAA